jgi:Glycosyltransferase Family 4
VKLKARNEADRIDEFPEPMKKLLMVAYHFPPLAGSSGVQRTLRFAQHLPEFGWQPLVLTASTRAYERCSPDLDREVPASCVVRRAFAMDTARQLSVGGRYIAAMARPDRWVSWKFGAIREGLRMIEEFKPDLIWSTYPIATAHLIGAELARRSSLPWVADFRDPMAQQGYPSDPKTWLQFSAIEQSAMQQARLNVFASPGAARLYRKRYPAAAARITSIENGYDESNFAAAELPANSRLNKGAFTLLHSGIVYPNERDPGALFIALGKLKSAGHLRPGQFKLRFRAAVHEQLLGDLAIANDVQDLIEILAPTAYQQALQEMQQADALLLMQGAGCNQQTPAKIYEYMRCAKPILALTDRDGDTAALLRRCGVHSIARLDSPEEIERLLPDFIEQVRAETAALPDHGIVRSASRRNRTEALASQLNALAR